MTQQFNFNRHCERLIANSKRRNADTVTRRLDTICELLRKDGYRAIQTMLGGSVKKGTFVSGISDVDVLLIVNETPFVNQPPNDVIEHIKDVVQGEFPKNPVRAGKLAVTINYADGMEIQLLPTIRTTSGGMRISDPGNTKWSNVVIPENFTKKLTKINRANGGRVLPAIKLVKAMADCYISRPSKKISGYHMEALAVDAFNGYSGKKDPKSMLIHFLDHSIDAVMIPIDDPTRQTPHVDDGLGTANSDQRKLISGYFENMRGQVRNCNTIAKFNKLFCLRI